MKTESDCRRFAVELAEQLGVGWSQCSSSYRPGWVEFCHDVTGVEVRVKPSANPRRREWVTGAPYHAFPDVRMRSGVARIQGRGWMSRLAARATTEAKAVLKSVYARMAED